MSESPELSDKAASLIAMVRLGERVLFRSSADKIVVSVSRQELFIALELADAAKLWLALDTRRLMTTFDHDRVGDALVAELRRTRVVFAIEERATAYRSNHQRSIAHRVAT